jgi:hypothetical protein
MHWVVAGKSRRQGVATAHSLGMLRSRNAINTPCKALIELIYMHTTRAATVFYAAITVTASALQRERLDSIEEGKHFGCGILRVNETASNFSAPRP